MYSEFRVSKESANPLWDYFKISEEDVSKTMCIFCKKLWNDLFYKIIYHLAIL